MYIIRVISNEGDTPYEAKTKAEAVEMARRIALEDNKWIYLDADYVDPGTLHEGMIKEDQRITLTNPLIGG